MNLFDISISIDIGIGIHNDNCAHIDIIDISIDISIKVRSPFWHSLLQYRAVRHLPHLKLPSTSFKQNMQTRLLSLLISSPLTSNFLFSSLRFSSIFLL